MSMITTSNPLTFQDLIYRSNQFQFPTTSNLISNLQNVDETVVLIQAANTRIIVLSEVYDLFKAYLQAKMVMGSTVERQLYYGMSVKKLIQRLVLKRPLACLVRVERTLTRCGKTLENCKRSWSKVGTIQEIAPLVLNEYLSPDEVALSALLGASCPTYFINDGNLKNAGIPDTNPNNFIKQGIYIGLVGPRFGNPVAMEAQQLLAFKNHPGYATQLSPVMKRLWVDFYNIDKDNFQFNRVIHKVKASPSSFAVRKFKGDIQVLDLDLYRKRITINLKTLFLEAQLRGQEDNRKSWVRLVGLGLGVWLIHQKQVQVFLETVFTLLRSMFLPDITVLELIQFKDSDEITHLLQDTIINQKSKDKKTHSIQIKISPNTFPASKLDSNTLDKLPDKCVQLITTWAWDSNSFPGNEYWLGHIDTSSDPAAASCSTITQLLNPYINPYHNNVQVLK